MLKGFGHLMLTNVRNNVDLTIMTVMGGARINK